MLAAHCAATVSFDIVVILSEANCVISVRYSIWTLNMLLSHRHLQHDIVSRRIYNHYNDVIMGTEASQITDVSIVCSTVSSGHLKENIKAPRHWPLCGEFTGDRWIPPQKASNAENVSIWWRHMIQNTFSKPTSSSNIAKCRSPISSITIPQTHRTRQCHYCLMCYKGTHRLVMGKRELAIFGFRWVLDGHALSLQSP